MIKINKKLLPFIVFLLIILGSFASVGNNLKTNDHKQYNLKLEEKEKRSQLNDEDIKELRKLGEEKGWTFSVGETSATNRSMQELCGFKKPNDLRINEDDIPKKNLKISGDLPEKWDWREQNGCTPIRNQGSCGSCWAFGTVAPLESAIKIKTGKDVDLSEQWLVSCNTDGWGCNGGWWAHDYHYDKPGMCGGIGAVLEEKFPYAASDLPCVGQYNHDYYLDDIDGDGDAWNFIDKEADVPSVEKIKQAIYNYGPVSVAIYVNDAFRAYNGGVFNADIDGTPNHAVALVGWDDTKGENGVWILRNSWGAFWGEDGYMLIEYGCSKVGYAASYIEFYSLLKPKEKAKINTTIEMHKLSNNPVFGDFDSIDPLFFKKPEWYYQIVLKTGDEITEIYRYNKHSNKETPGNWFDYIHQHTWLIDQKYFIKSKGPYIDIKIKVMEYDEFDQCDLVDISSYPGGGLYDSIADKRQAIYHATYNLIKDNFVGDNHTKNTGYIVTEGDGNNRARLWFRMTDEYDAEIYKPVLELDTKKLFFEKISEGFFTKKIKIKNIAPEDPTKWAEKLEWNITIDKDWLTVDKKSGKIEANNSQTISVTVDPGKNYRNGNYTGLLKIESNDKQEIVEVSVKI